jgi:sugar/nucleoside kinase (ribokinase family)
MLSAQGVSPHLLVDSELPTGTIVILLDAAGGRTMLTQRGANAALSPDDLPDRLLDAADLCHVSGYSVFNALDRDPEEFPRFMHRARASQTMVSVDPGSAGFLRDVGPERFLAAIAGARVLLPNREEATVLTGEADPEVAASLLGERFPVVAVTAGESGTIVVDHRAAPTIVPVASVAARDPTGAGDAFDAGFVAALLAGSSAVEAARMAARVASQAVGIVGGRPVPSSHTLGG